MTKLTFLFIMIVCLARPAVAGQGFGFDQVVDQAKALAAKPFQPPAKTVPDFLKDMGYDQWRGIRFKNAMGLWAEGGPFQVRFFHLGFQYNQPVDMQYIDERGVHTFPFSPALFDY